MLEQEQMPKIPTKAKNSRFALSRNEKKNANHSVQNVQNMGNKELKYTKSLAKNQVCATFKCEIFGKTVDLNL